MLRSRARVRLRARSWNSIDFSEEDQVIGQNLTQSRKDRKDTLSIINDIFLAFLASLRENIVFTSSSKKDSVEAISQF